MPCTRTGSNNGTDDPRGRVVIDLFDADRAPHHTPAKHLFGYLFDQETRVELVNQ